MSGNVMAIIGGTVVIIALYLILTKQGQGANSGNAFTQVLSTLGTQYNSIVGTLMVRNN